MHRWASLAGVDWHLPYPTNTCAPTEAGVPPKPHPQPGFALKLDNPTDHDSIPGLGLGRQHFLSATFLWALGWRLCWDHGVVAVLVLRLLGRLAMLYPVPTSAWHLLESALVCLGHLLTRIYARRQSARSWPWFLPSPITFLSRLPPNWPINIIRTTSGLRESADPLLLNRRC